MDTSGTESEARQTSFELAVWAGRHKPDWRPDDGDRRTRVGQLWQGPGGGLYRVEVDPVRLVWTSHSKNAMDDQPRYTSPLGLDPASVSPLTCIAPLPEEPVPDINLDDKVLCAQADGTQYTVTAGELLEAVTSESNLKNTMIIRFNEPETREEVKTAARDSDMPASEWLRRAVAEKLARDKPGRAQNPDGWSRGVCLDVDFDMFGDMDSKSLDEQQKRVDKITGAIETLVQALGGSGVIVKEHPAAEPSSWPPSSGNWSISGNSGNSGNSIFKGGTVRFTDNITS